MRGAKPLLLQLFVVAVGKGRGRNPQCVAYQVELEGVKPTHCQPENEADSTSDHQHLMEFTGEGYDPVIFDVKETNKFLKA